MWRRTKILTEYRQSDRRDTDGDGNNSCTSVYNGSRVGIGTKYLPYHPLAQCRIRSRKSCFCWLQVNTSTANRFDLNWIKLIRFSICFRILQLHKSIYNCTFVYNCALNTPLKLGPMLWLYCKVDINDYVKYILAGECAIGAVEGEKNTK